MGDERVQQPELAPAPAPHAAQAAGPAPRTGVVPLPLLAARSLERPAPRGGPLARLRSGSGGAAAAGAPAPVIRRVLFDGVDAKESGAKGAQHAQILSDALLALKDGQNQDATDPDTWMWWVTDINSQLQLAGVSPAVLSDIEEFYKQVEELSFLSNPFLRQVWQNCLDATRSAAAKSKYSQVGSKFLRQSMSMLDEIKTDFPSLSQLCDDVKGFMKGYNKEHLVNKGGTHLGPQVDHDNLMGAGTPLVMGGSSISPFHQGLHAMKAGTGSLDYTALDPKIRKVIEKCQKGYSKTTMGTF
jgi:hypothetical protein